MQAKKNRVMASSIDSLRLSRSGSNYYITTYMVFDGEDFIGYLDHHNTGVKHEYYVAWHMYGVPGPNQAGNTKNFDSKDEALQWLLDNKDMGDLRK